MNDDTIENEKSLVALEKTVGHFPTQFHANVCRDGGNHGLPMMRQPQ